MCNSGSERLNTSDLHRHQARRWHTNGPEYLRPPVLPVQKLTARLQKLGPAAQGSKAVSSRAVTLNLPSAVTL